MATILAARQPMDETVDHSWAPGPLLPHLAEGTLDVWRADLESVTDDVLELLSAEERARAERVRSEHARRRWARSRGLLRALLGRYLQTDPGTLVLAIGAHGKPGLPRGPAPTGAAPRRTAEHAASWELSFNLSHSAPLALYAFTRIGAVGVDVEVARRRIDAVAIAARTLGPDQARRLENLGPAEREREFLRAWTRHEAGLKCLGTGIGRTPADGERPWIAELQVGRRGAAAVALQRPARLLRCWEWPPVAGDPGRAAELRGSSRQPFG